MECPEVVQSSTNAECAAGTMPASGATVCRIRVWRSTNAVCGGDDACLGCDGVPDSGLEVDQCGVCGGSDACVGCDGVPNSGVFTDQCGVRRGRCLCGLRWRAQLGAEVDDCGGAKETTRVSAAMGALQRGGTGCLRRVWRIGCLSRMRRGPQ